MRICLIFQIKKGIKFSISFGKKRERAFKFSLIIFMNDTYLIVGEILRAFVNATEFDVSFGGFL